MKTGRVLALVQACLCAATASAQSGSIEGTVSDPSGAVLPGVTVEAASPALIEQSRGRSPTGRAATTSSSCGRAFYALTFTIRGLPGAEAREHRVDDGIHGRRQRDAAAGARRERSPSRANRRSSTP